MCLCFVACSVAEEPDDNANASAKPAQTISTSLGSEAKIYLKTGEEKIVSFKANVDSEIYESSFSPVVINSDLIDVEYYGISGKYVYYKLTAKSAGTTEMYVELSGASVRSENIKVIVTNNAPDYIVGSLGENAVSIIEGRKAEICFAVLGYNLSPESVSVVVGDEDIVTVSYLRVSDCYIYYKVEARKAGTTTVYIETADGAVKSMPINISVIAKGTLSEEEPLTGFFVNTNSKNFHKANCSVVDSIKDENKAYYDCEREELIEAGYSPCKTCNP